MPLLDLIAGSGKSQEEPNNLKLPHNVHLCAPYDDHVAPYVPTYPQTRSIENPLDTNCIVVAERAPQTCIQFFDMQKHFLVSV